MQELSVEVANGNRIKINQPELADACQRQRIRNRRAQPAGADNEDVAATA